MNYEQSLRDTFLKMDEKMKTMEGAKEVQRLARDLPSHQPVSFDSCQTFAGSSGLVVLFDESRVYVANAGDSRCVLLKKGQVVEMNDAHSPGDQKEMNRIFNAGGFLEDGRIMGNLTTSRGFGYFEFKRNSHVDKKDQIVSALPDVKVLDLDKNEDVVVIGTKGVWDTASPQEMIRVIQQKIDEGKTIGQLTEEILDESLSENPQIQETLGCDNMTLILIFFKDSSILNSKKLKSQNK
jgi:protein phosphatase 1G